MAGERMDNTERGGFTGKTEDISTTNIYGTEKMMLKQIEAMSKNHMQQFNALIVLLEAQQISTPMVFCLGLQWHMVKPLHSRR
ncbi:hypothetical protein KXD40_004367 [Peronospora effusa]|nr:hypothetical protein KXD40_004367 [Peronospora effusa]